MLSTVGTNVPSPSILMGLPRLKHLAELTRRTFTPAEVQLIYSELGEP